MSHKPPLTEADLRDVRDDLKSRFADQARQLGVLPKEEKYEQIIDPVIEKVAREHEQERHKPAPAAENRQAHIEDEDGLKVTREVVGDFKWDLETNTLTPAPGTRVDVPRDTPRVAALKERLRFLMTIPRWKERIIQVTNRKFRTREERVKEYRQIFADAVREFGPQRITK